MSNVNHLLKYLVNSPTLGFAIRSVYRGIFPWLRDRYKSRIDVLKPETNAEKTVYPNLYMLRNNGGNSRSFSNPSYLTNQFSYHKRWHKYGKAFRFFEQTHGYG